MKKYIMTIAVGLLISATSCDSFLEEDNKSSINSDAYFAEKEGYESLVNSCYSSLRTVWKGDPCLFCFGTDMYNRGESEMISGSYQNRDTWARELNDYDALNSENEAVTTFWTNVYKGIQICNTAIARGDKENGTHRERIAEARVIRAYYYFKLVEQFGDVPIVTDEIKTPVTHFDRTPEADVYKFIITELNEAEKDLLETSAEFGRVNKFVVKNLLSLVYLTRGYKAYADNNDFRLAAQLADEVINSGHYQLLPTFSDVFRADNLKNEEVIWSIQFDPKSLQNVEDGNGQNLHFGWETWTKIQGGFTWVQTTYNKREPQFTPSQFLYSLFNTNIDSRYDATFLSEYYATMDSPEYSVKKGDLRVYFPTYDQLFTKEDSLKLIKENPGVIIVPKERWKPDIDKVGGSGIFPMVNKFYDPQAPFQGNWDHYTNTRDMFIYRLAETYLISAEAYLKLGDKATAAKRINVVRERAAKPGHKADMDVAPGQVNIDLILDERARELVGEYKRWPDLKRTGKLIERAKAHNILAARANKIDNHHLLRPIPQTIIDQDTGEFPQNPDY